jgi:hypothetical protein
VHCFEAQGEPANSCICFTEQAYGFKQAIPCGVSAAIHLRISTEWRFRFSWATNISRFGICACPQRDDMALLITLPQSGVVCFANIEEN